MKLRLPSWAILLLICVVVGGVLGAVNDLTAGPIAQQAVEAANAARRKCFADADSFEKMELAEDSGVDACYMAMKDGQLAGYVAQVTVTGFGGPVEIHVGMNLEQSITGINVGGSNFSETPGLGDKAREPEFAEQFVGLTIPNARSINIINHNNFSNASIISCTIDTSNSIPAGIPITVIPSGKAFLMSM